MRHARSSVPWSVVSAFLLASTAHADDVGNARFRLDPVQPASALSPFFTVEGSVPRDGAMRAPFSLSLLTTYARAPLTVHISEQGDTRRLGTPVEHAVIAHLVGSAQIGEALAIDVALPVTVAQSGRDVVAESVCVDAPDSSAVGDLRVGAVWRRPVTERLELLAAARAWAPTGSLDAYAGDGRFRLEVLAGGTARSQRTRGACNVGGSPAFVAPRAGDRLYADCAFEALPLPSGPWLGGEVVAQARRVDRHIATGSEVEIWATAHQSAGPFRMGLGAGPGLGSSPGTPVFRVLASFAWVPASMPPPAPRPPSAPADPDMDGIPGSADACPDEAGPSADDPAANGCPRKNSDHDGIEDRSDDCLTEKGMASDLPKSNGCPDRDNDHVADVLDQCPDEPGRPSADPASSGCPKRARLRDGRFVISPPLTAAADQPDAQADDEALWDVAFALRSSPGIGKVAVEVRLAAPEEDIETTADRALGIANDLVQRLVDLGVDRARLDPVGVIADTPGVVIRVVDTTRSSPP